MAVKVDMPKPSETKENLPNEKALIAAGSRGLQLTSLSTMYRFAQYVVASGFAPKQMERPESVLIAIQMGAEIGLLPMQSIQNIAVINGRPSVWGDAAKGLCEASPLCEYINEWYEGEYPNDDFRGVCEAKRKGRDKPVRVEFSIADAKLAGLWGKTGKTGQPTPWVTYPKRMLRYRPRGFCLRDTFPDLLKGLYIAEEARDLPAAIDVVAEEVHEPFDAPTTLEDLEKQLGSGQPDLNQSSDTEFDTQTTEVLPEPELTDQPEQATSEPESVMVENDDSMKDELF